MATVREIANLAGVSKSTVSLVLNNKPGVSEEKRRRVLAAQRELMARSPVKVSDTEHLPVRSDPNGHGQKRVGDALSIVVLHPPVLRSSYVFSEVLQGIQSAAETYNVQLRLVANSPTDADQHVSRLYFTDPALRPDGVLLFGAQQYEPMLEVAEQANIPCVVLGRDTSRYDVSGLGRNEYHHAYEATTYLITLGHRAIAFLGGDSAYDYLHTRQAGYRQALADHHIALEDGWIQMGTGDAATAQVLATAPRVTALMYINDVCAAEGLPLVEAAGLAVPDDLSVLSFDDTTFAQTYTPPLTSVSYRRYEEGQWGVKMLVDQIRYPYLERVQVIFRAGLVERGSCCPPRG